MHSLISCTYCNQALNHKDVWGVEVWSPHILTFSIRLSSSGHDHFIPRARTPGTHWIEGWVGPGAGLNAVTKIKIPVSFQAFTGVSIFCDVKQFSLVNVYQCFGRMNCVCLQSKGVSWTVSQASSKQSIPSILLAWLTVWLWHVWQPIIWNVKIAVTLCNLTFSHLILCIQNFNVVFCGCVLFLDPYSCSLTNQILEAICSTIFWTLCKSMNMRFLCWGTYQDHSNHSEYRQMCSHVSLMLL